jgi:L-threonylcarbamoyladenylate synthase
LAAPSANPFGYISPTLARHVKDQLDGKIEYILDGGPCEKGLESTIIGFLDGNPVLYRLGAITTEEIEKVIGHPLTIKNETSYKPLGPGMLPYHYAPITNAILTDNIFETINESKASNIGLITISTELLHSRIKFNRLLSLNNNLQEVGRKLYSTLRFMDNQQLDLIVIERMPDHGLGKTINDRLEKAVARTKTFKPETLKSDL